jgi:hypothetical protein
MYVLNLFQKLFFIKLRSQSTLILKEPPSLPWLSYVYKKQAEILHVITSGISDMQEEMDVSIIIYYILHIFINFLNHRNVYIVENQSTLVSMTTASHQPISFVYHLI